MSLTSFLKSKTIRENFKEKFPLPKLDHDGKILASPISKNYSLIDTAFNYLVRFNVKRLSPNLMEREWVAENAVERIKYYSGNYVLIDGTDVISFDRNEFLAKQFLDMPGIIHCDYSKEWANAVEPAKKIISDTKIHLEKFNQSGELTDDLIRSALKLAQLDIVIRDATLCIDEPVSVDDVKDLRSLFDVASASDLFNDLQIAFLNPTFGKGSELVEGADADLIINDTLIDIAVTENLKLTHTLYNRIIGYYVLSGIENTFGGIKNIGVYFARHGFLFKTPVNNVGKPKDFVDALEWFNTESKRRSDILSDATNAHFYSDVTSDDVPQKKKSFWSCLFKRK